MSFKKPGAGLGLGGQQNALSTFQSTVLTSKTYSDSEYYQFEQAEVMQIDLNPEKPENVGRIQIRPVSKTGSDVDSLSWAFPLVPYYRMYPVIGETVVIVDFEGRYYWLSILNSLNMLNNNLQTNISERNFKSSDIGNSTDYRESQAFGLPSNETEKDGSPGETFKNQRMKVGILSPNEGDTIIEGRYCNSIRLGNNPETNTPNIKISVRDLLENLSIDNENLDEDSCIFITTDEILTFNPIGIPISDINNPPNEYSGKQILITSDRLVFGAKLSEILMFSNKTISLASSDNFSVDTNTKIITNSASNTEFNTQEKLITTSKKNTELLSNEQVLIQSDKETKIKALKVMIGKMDANEPLVLGNKWKDIMIELLDAILQLTVPTGTGPSGPPINSQSFIRIKNSISSKNQLSDDNFTAKKN